VTQRPCWNGFCVLTDATDPTFESAHEDASGYTWRQPRDWVAIGRRAYRAGAPCAPTLDETVRAAINGLPAGGDARAVIMQGWLRGWRDACWEFNPDRRQHDANVIQTELIVEDPEGSD
jgi:hypothetical protein